MEQQMAFVRAILDAPDDLTARLVFAAWLDERGDPRGEYIRARAGGQTGGVSQGRCEELRSVIDPGWLPLLGDPPCQEQGWRIDVNPAPLRAATVAATLDRLTGPAAPEMFTADLSFEGRHEYDDGAYALHLGVFVSGDRVCVEFEDFDGEFAEERGRQRNLDHWRSRDPDPPLRPRAGVRFLGYPALRRDWVDVHLGWTIPRADALMALAYHYIYFGHWRGGSNTFAPWVAWERCDDCPLESPPPQAPWRPKGPTPPMWSGHEEDELGEA